MRSPTPQALAESLEHVVEINGDEPCTIHSDDYDMPIVALGIGSLDLIEWAFALEEEFDLEIEIDTLEGIASFSIVDASQWIKDIISNRTST